MTHMASGKPVSRQDETKRMLSAEFKSVLVLLQFSGMVDHCFHRLARLGVIGHAVVHALANGKSHGRAHARMSGPAHTCAASKLPYHFEGRQLMCPRPVIRRPEKKIKER